MEGILIKGISMPEERGFIDLRIYGSGKVVSPCGGEFAEAEAKPTTIEEDQ